MCLNTGFFFLGVLYIDEKYILLHWNLIFDDRLDFGNLMSVGSCLGESCLTVCRWIWLPWKVFFGFSGIIDSSKRSLIPLA